MASWGKGGANRGNQKASWRRSAQGPVPPPTTAGHEVGRRGRGRRALLFRVSLLITLAIGLGFTLVQVMRRQPARVVPLVVTAVTRSGPQLDAGPGSVMPNPFATEDVETLGGWFGGGQRAQNVQLFGRLEDQTGALTSETNELLNALTGALAHPDLKPGGPEGNTLAVFLTAHGIVERGEPYLLMGDSTPGEPGSWVALETVFRGILETVEQESARLGQPRVVVFLDAARSGAAWSWGKFEEDFNQGCRGVLRKLGADRLAVITSGELGERSWCDPRRANSLFVDALVQAFTGGADFDGDGGVTVGEITRFLREQVSLEAKSIWDASQHPTLLTDDAAEWLFIHEPEHKPGPPSAPPDMDELDKQFARAQSLWRRHNSLQAAPHPPLASDPVRWSELERWLARLDQLLMAGRGYRAEFDAAASSCDSLLTRFEAGLPVTPSELPERSLQRYFAAPGAEPSIDPEWREAWEEKPVAASIPEPISESQAVDLVLPWLKQQDFDPESLQAAGRLLKERTDGAPRLLESHLIRLLAAPDMGHVSAETAAAVFESHQASREVILTKDPRALFWIQEEVDRAERERLSATDAVLAPGPDAQTPRPLKDHARDGGAYARLRDRGDLISDAYRRRDAMLHAVPRIAETLLSDARAYIDEESSAPTSKLIRRAMDAAVELADRLRLRERGIEDSDWERVESAVAEADAAMQALRGRLRQRVDSASGSKAADESGLRQAYAMLVGSGVAQADRRAALHRRLIELLRVSSDIGRVGQTEASSASERSARAADLIAIDGQPPWNYWLEQLEPVREESRGDSGQPGAVFRAAIRDFHAAPAGADRKLAEILRSPAERTGEGLGLAAVRSDLDELERELRGKTVLLGNSPREITGAVVTRFAVDLQLWMYVHAARTLQEFWCEAVAGESPYFEKAAERLLKPLIMDPDLRLEPRLGGRDLRESLAEAAAAAQDGATLRASATEGMQDGALYKLISGQTMEFRLGRPSNVPVGRAAVWSSDISQGAQLLPVGAADDAIATSLVVPTDLSPRRDAFPVQTFFRGLRRTGGMPLRHLVDPLTTVFRLPDYGPPEVVVSRDDPDPVPVVVVMDCSNSMNKGEPVSRTRLEMAKGAMRDFLSGHVGKGQVTIGLVLFGHRYGWQLNDEDNLIADGPDGEKYKVYRMAGEKKQTLAAKTLDSPSQENPNRDVEAVIGIKRSAISGRDFEELVEVIDGIKAVGTTPTYQAVIEAYRMLGDHDTGHILVLTDGAPFLVGAGTDEYGEQIERLQRGFAETAQQLHEQHPQVQLTFVNFQDRGQSDDAVIRDLEGYFRGANFEPAIGGEALFEVLEGSIGNPTAVWKRDGKLVGRRFDFGQPGTIDPWPPAGVRVEPGRPVRPAAAYEVEVDTGPVDSTADALTAAVKVEGGERFNLHLGDGQLFHRRYSRLDLNVQHKLALSGGDADRYDVYALLPNLNNNRGLTLPLVVQNKNSKEFSPRPVDVWVDLIGFNQEQPGDRRVAYSINLPEYQSRQPVPVMLLRVRDWPTWANRVQVKAWVRFLGPPAKSVELPLDAPPDSATAGGIRLEEIEGVQFRVDRQRTSSGGVRLVVTEEYRRGEEVNRLRVVTEPLPKSAAVSLYPEEGVVERTFEFAEPVNGLRAMVTDRVWIESGAATNADASDELRVDDR